MRAQWMWRAAAAAVIGVALAGCGPSAEDVIADAEAQADAAVADAQASAEAIAADVRAEVEAAASEAAAQAQDLEDSADVAAEQAAGQLGTAGGGGGLTPDGDKTESPTPQPTTPDPTADLAGGRFDINGLADAMMAIRQAVGTETFELLQVQLLQTGRTTFQVRDPGNPDNVDQYTWNGVSLGQPEPVQLVGGGDLASSVFPADQVIVEGAQAAYDAAVGLDVEGGEVASMTLRINPFDGLSWGVPVSGTRESKIVYAAPSGEVIRVA